MANVTRVALSVTWLSCYPTLLAAGAGALLTRRDFNSILARRTQLELAYPWERDEPGSHWSRFWEYYMGGARALRLASDDVTWERLVPLRLEQSVPLLGPADTSAFAVAWAYPAAVAVTAFLVV